MVQFFLDYPSSSSMGLDGEKRAKGEEHYRGDRCLNVSELTNNTNFTEVREFVGYQPLTVEEKKMEREGAFHWSDTVLIRFVFITRSWNTYVEEAFDAVTEVIRDAVTFIKMDLTTRRLTLIIALL